MSCLPPTGEMEDMEALESNLSNMRYPIYNIDEFTHGVTEYTTPCPFGVHGKYTGEILRVGSLACIRCKYFKGINRIDCIVSCGIK